MTAFLRKYLFLVVPALMLATSGCEKANHAAFTPALRAELASARYYYLDGTSYDINYHYDSLKHLIREEQVNSAGMPFFSKEYHYEGEQLLLTRLGTDPTESAVFRHRYQDNHLIHSVYEESNSLGEKHHFERTYEYQENKLVKITHHDLVNDSMSSYSVFIYKGTDISEIRNYNLQRGVLEEDVSFEYDHRKNPLYGVTANTGNIRYSASGNVVRIKTIIEGGRPSGREQVFEYEYNEYGYPIKSYQVLENGARLPEAGFTYSTP